MKKKIIIIAGILFFVIILLPVVAVKVVTTFFLTPEYLTEKITSAINRETNINFKCEKIELTYISTWPDISLSINNGKMEFPVSVHDTINRSPLMVEFDKIYGSLNAVELIRNKNLCLENLTIESPKINYLKDSRIDNILKNTDETAGTYIKTNINEIKISNGYLNITDNNENTYVNAKDIDMNIKGELTSNEPDFKINFKCDSIRTGIKGFPDSNISIELESECLASEKFKTIDFDNAQLVINNFPLDLKGNISGLSEKENPYINITFNLPSSDIQELNKYVPQDISDYYKDYIIKGNTSLNGYIKGKLAKGELPDIKINGNIENGSIFKKNITKGIDKINMKLMVSYVKDKPDSCFINMDDITVQGFDSNLSLKGQINNLQDKPFLYSDIKSNINADKISKDFIPADITTLKGYIDADMSIAFTINDFIDKKWNRIWMTGSLVAKEFELASKKYDIEAYSSNTSLNFGYKKNKSDFIKDDEVMNGLIDIDSIRIIYKDDMSVKISNLHARSNTSISKENEVNPPVTVHLNCSQMEARIDKSQWMSATEMTLHAGTKVSPTDKTRNVGAIVVDAANFKYIDNNQENAIVLNKCNFIAEAHPLTSKGTEPPFKFLKDWDVKGILNFETSKCFICIFPQMTSISNTQLSFKNNQLSVNRAQIKTGKSDFMLSGIISTTKAKNDKNLYEGTLQVLAGNINYNEIKHIVNKGNGIKNDKKDKGQFTLDNVEEKMTTASSNGDEAKPFYIPDNISLNIQTNVDNFNYNEVEMLRLSGDVIIKNSKARININTRTNLGKVHLEMLYDSKNTKNIKTVFDLQLNDILIGQIYQVIPEMAKTLPILKSVDGIASCHLTGEIALGKNTIEPDLKTAKAVCSLSGNNLKLIDNRTFEEIAKKFRFKDKKHNNINHVSADLILNKGEINVLPFMISWDRYDAILGGKQNLDFEYDYHIDIVKSPIPIDFGVNITGKGNNIEYKIKKCKYKKSFLNDGNMTETNSKTEYLRKQITKAIYNPL